MYLDAFFKAVDDVFCNIQNTQRKSIVKAAEIIAKSLANKGAWLVMDTGHMLRHEASNRAGGLVALTPFSYSLTVENPLDHRPVERTDEEAAALEARLVTLALDTSKLKHGDVVMINSNSGRTPNVIETALQCKERDILTVAVCSKEQMAHCEAAHPSGKKLFDVADICIDNCGPHGDAAVDVDNNENICPMSGLAATYVFWAVHAEVITRLQAAGVKPTIYRSVHVGGPEFVEEQRRRFREQGI